MTRFGLALVAAWTLCSPSFAHGDGLYRRLPEAGEFAKYDVVLIAQVVGDDENNRPELAGTLLLQCVGVEEIEGEKHYWLETTLSLLQFGGSTEFTFKLLVPELQILEGDPVENFTRGWYSDSQLGEPIALQHAHMDIAEDPMTLIVRAVFRGPHEELEALDQAQTIELADRTFAIASAEQGYFEEDELVDAADAPHPLTGWGSWWLHEDAAFGVAASEQLWAIETKEAGVMEFALQFTLTETGDGAVSALLEHH